MNVHILGMSNCVSNTEMVNDDSLAAMNERISKILIQLSCSNMRFEKSTLHHNAVVSNKIISKPTNNCHPIYIFDRWAFKSIVVVAVVAVIGFGLLFAHRKSSE